MGVVGVRRNGWWALVPPELAVLLAAILVELVLLAAIPYLATTDGAIHLGSAAALRDFATDTNAIHHAYLEVFWFPVPNLIPELIMAALLSIADPGSAEKLFVAGYVAGLPVAMFYALGAVSRHARWLALVAIPLTFNASLHFGFYNFCYGLVAFLIVTGYLLRHRELVTRRERSVLAVLLLLVFFTHIVPFVEAILLGGMVVVSDWVREGDGRRPRARTLFGLAAPWVMAAAPSVALAVLFFVQGGTQGSDYRRDFLTLLLGLPSLAWPIVSYDRWESAFTLLLGSVLFATTLAVLRSRRPLARIRPWDWALGFAVLSMVAYLVAPEALGSGGVISQRLALFPVIGMVIWLGSHLPEIDRRWVALVSVASVLSAAGLAVIRAPSYVATSDAVADYVSIEPCLARGSTIVQANLSWLPSGPLGRISPLIHDAGRLAAASGGHDLGSITGEVPLFVLQNRAENDPFTYLVTRQNGEYEVPPGIDPLGYEASTDGQVDYVVLFGRMDATGTTLGSAAWRDLEAQLATGYRLVDVSPTGRVELYERTVGDLMADGDARRSDAGGRCGA